MASSKSKAGQNLDDLLRPDVPQGYIKRGAGLHTSLDTNTDTNTPPVTDSSVQNRTSAKTHKTTTSSERIARGYKFREDLIKQCKQIALDEDRKLYEVMEEALEEYIARKQMKR